MNPKRTAVIALIASRAVASLGQLALNYVVGNFHGVELLGQVSAALALIMIAATPARLGLDGLAVRVVGVATEMGNPQRTADFLTGASFIVMVLTSLLVTISYMLSGNIMQAFKLSPDIYFAFLPLLYYFSFAYLLSAILRASTHAIAAQLIEVGGFALVLSMLAAMLSGRHGLLTAIFSANVLGLIALASAAIVFIPRPASVLRSCQNGLQLIHGQWQSVLTITGITLIQFAIQWVPVPMAAYFLDSSASATVGVGQRLSMVVFIILGLIGGVMAPRYAGLYAAGKYADILDSEKRIRRGLTLFGVAALLGALLLGKWLVTRFNVDATQAFPCFLIMLIGQALNLSTGSSQFLMVPLQLETQHFKVLIATALAMLALAAILSSKLGVMGIAIAQAVAVAGPAIWSTIKVRSVLHRALASQVP